MATNPNGPHNNYVGAGYTSTGKNAPKLLDPKENRIGNHIGYEPYCLFCGETQIISGKKACGQSTNGGTITAICQRVILGKSILTKPEKMEWVKPNVNCPACGAYCAHKHRIGCKAVVTC